MSSIPQPISTSEENKRLVRHWFEQVWNQSRRDVIADLLAPECVIYDGTAQIHGPHEFELYHDSLRERFSDIRVTPGISLSEGDLVAHRWTVNCRDKASGKNLSATGISIVRIKDGHFIEGWQNWDQAAIAAQLSA